jgi:cellulose synthase/poly-beta-1,6-N-acetylglucosamine synthase-like glycosyltransferase
LIDSAIIERNGGWSHFLLTEDIEFTADCVIHGDRVGYCHGAELFDEQPETFSQSWRQRKRWAKGMFQVFRNYGRRLLKGALKLKWSNYDMTMNIMPAFMLSAVQLFSILPLFIINLIVHQEVSQLLLNFLLEFIGFGYGIFFVLGLFTLITEWRKIHCNKFRAILLLFTFPLFMLTYIPIAFSALFSRRVEWKPVEHKYAMSAGEIEAAGAKPVLKEEAETEPVSVGGSDRAEEN